MTILINLIQKFLLSSNVEYILTTLNRNYNFNWLCKDGIDDEGLQAQVAKMVGNVLDYAETCYPL